MTTQRDVPTVSPLRRARHPWLLLAVPPLVLALWWLLPVSALVANAVHFIQNLGLLGVLVYAVVYITAIVAMAPGLMLTLAAGFIWGPLMGALVAWPSSLLAATTAFVVGRYLARTYIEQRFGNRALFRAIERATALHGLKIVILLRLSPVAPFGLLNYGFGLTQLKTRSYALATGIGLLPMTFLYAYVGSLAKSVADLGTAGAPVRGVLYWVGLGATVLVTLFVTKIARGVLREHLETARNSGSPSVNE